MWTQAGFSVECKSSSDAEQVAQSMKEYLNTQKLSDDNWKKGIFITGTTVKLDNDTYTIWDDWDGLFEAMCEYVENHCSGLLLRGESTFEESTGGRNQVSFEMTGDGISFARRVVDYDVIMQMLEAGLEPEQVAEETGMSVEELEAFMDYDEDK